MSKLRSIRSRLGSLRRTRWFIRWASALAAVALAVVVAGLLVFALDYTFELFVVQRVIVMAVAATGVLAAAVVFIRPALATRESEIDIALQVERTHNINSDLVASLQFEAAQPGAWGSPQLAGAVIDSVAGRGDSLDVFQGLSWQKLLTRFALFVIAAVIAGGLVLAYPAHANIFWRRLGLASTHYPSATKIDRIYIGSQRVLSRAEDGAAPQDIRQPQNRPLNFYMVCSGEIYNGETPVTAYSRVSTSAAAGEDASTRRFDLTAVSLTDRQAMLKTAATDIQKAIDAGASDLTTSQKIELATLTAADAPETSANLLDDKAATDLAALKSQIEEVLASWPGEAKQQVVYRGEVGRLLQPVSYRLYAGDAWTDPASVDIIPLPVVDPVLTPVLPAYARRGKERAAEPSARQISVLEGSAVKLEVASRTKQLRAAWLRLETSDGSERFDLTPIAGSKNLRWKLPEDSSPLKNIQHDTRFVIQVTDTDGLHLEDALQGYIRIRDDRRPTGSLNVVHRVLLPGAEPVLEYNVNDDYGIGRVQLNVQVHRQNPVSTADRASSPEAYTCDVDPVGVEPVDVEETTSVETGESTADATATPTRENPEDASAPPGAVVRRGCMLTIIAPAKDGAKAALPPGALPRQGQFKLSLAGYKLAKGDQVHVSLEVTDYRGATKGESFETAPLILDISDRNGVLAAVLEADEKSEKELSSIIQQLLGIGDSP